MLSFVLPTRNRSAELDRTLAALGAIEPRVDAEVIVVDNHSAAPVTVPGRLANGWHALTLRLRNNAGAAARNEGARIASGKWIVMLDDDSYPLDLGVVDAIHDAEPDVAAIGAEISLLNGGHEAGGLPEVIVGCGAAIRRESFMAVGGYDPSFHFYVEEYDLCAKLILAGDRVVQDRRFRVRHEKSATGRDMNLVLSRLVRNNGWIAARYAPDDEREAALRETIERYAVIARREQALGGYEAGLAELRATLDAQPRIPMSDARWDRFVGRTAARAGLRRSVDRIAGRRVGLVAAGKGSSTIETLVRELGGTIVPVDDASTLVVGTLSPGPMLDAVSAWSDDPRPLVAPWSLAPEMSALRRAG
ncbi:MAG: glycosyltransferase [Phycisphaerales bacterium]